ncbi:hypothetical protein MicvaDRAFT_3930 [Microcoleus vaginatus FGP-2]|nr:hypothetical protein MicvaDRAFT_3930 [Microcoleus vaginatus FGP-2]
MDFGSQATAWEPVKVIENGATSQFNLIPLLTFVRSRPRT